MDEKKQNVVFVKIINVDEYNLLFDKLFVTN